jgi:flagellar assembly protein FliH
MSSEAALSTVRYPALHDRQLEQRGEQARVSGHAAGYAAGLRAAEREIAAMRDALQNEHAAAARAASDRLDRSLALLEAAAAALDARTEPLLRAVNDTLAEGAIDLAEAVVAAELSGPGAAAAAALRRAFATVEADAVHTVRLNPADLETLGGSALQRPSVRFVADPALRPGDAVSEFADGYLDSRVSTAFARARLAIEEAS